jgi:hypothetical protein
MHLAMHVGLWIVCKSTDTNMEKMRKFGVYPRTNYPPASGAEGKNARSRTSAYTVVACTGTALRPSLFWDVAPSQKSEGLIYTAAEA